MIGRDDPEFFFWLRHARRSQEPVVTLNDGKGRVAFPLAEQGISVIAISPHGSDAPPSPVDATVQWLQGEVSTFQLARKAGMVCLAERSLERLLTLDEQWAALRNIHRNLQVGGKLAFDLSLPPLGDLANSRAEGAPVHSLAPVEGPEGGQTLLQWEVRHVDWIRQCMSRRVTYESVSQKGESLRRWHEEETRAFFWPRGVRLLLEATGYDIEAAYGGWNDEPLDDAATRQVWVARKGV